MGYIALTALFIVSTALLNTSPKHSAPSSSATSVYPANGFGGYESTGQLGSISANFVVPTIAPRSTGDASTWISAEDQSFGHFIQLGVTEDKYVLNAAQYVAFWSDDAVGFHPHSLGSVGAGDLVSVSMTQDTRGWFLRLVDRRTKDVMEKQINYGRGVTYVHGDWQQEDPTSSGIAAQDLPYPMMSLTRFSRLRVNQQVPTLRRENGGILMASNGTIRVPTPVRNGAFTYFVPTGVTARYLSLQAAADASDAAFDAHFARWTRASPGERARFVNELSTSYARFLRALRTVHWPASLRSTITQLSASVRSERSSLRAWSRSGYDVGADAFARANDQHDVTRSLEDDVHQLLGVPPTE